MLLTLAQAAELLGQSRRQIRYLIKTGRLPAVKVGGHWRIDSERLPRSPGQRAAAERKQQHLVEVVEEALALPSASDRKRYSVRDLRAFQIGAAIYRDATARLAPDHPAAGFLRQVLEHVALGCHRFRQEDKVSEYQAARDHASRAACTLAIDATAPAQELLDRVEQDLMAALGGLVRRMERRTRRGHSIRTGDADLAEGRDA
jgi:excisionase family DNA binding protein